MGILSEVRKLPNNMKVFYDTLKCCDTNSKLKEAIRISNTYQEFIPEGKKIDVFIPNREHTAEIAVTPKRTLEAAREYANAGRKTCILSFANAKTPGGGVKYGSPTQEEGICRCSTLYKNLVQSEMINNFYEPHKKISVSYNDDIIYTPDVVVFKTDNRVPKRMAEKDWYKVNVITCAAPDLGDTGNIETLSSADLKDIHYKRATRIFEVANVKGNEVLILGAFGCGDFKNQPFIVANAFAAALEEYIRKFKKIEFAIYDKGTSSNNLYVFEEVMRECNYLE